MNYLPDYNHAVSQVQHVIFLTCSLLFTNQGAESHRFKHAEVRNLIRKVPKFSRPLNSGIIVEDMNIPILVGWVGTAPMGAAVAGAADLISTVLATPAERRYSLGMYVDTPSPEGRATVSGKYGV